MAEESGEVPQYFAYMNPILAVLRASDREALTIEELDRRVFASMQLPSTLIAVPHDPARPDRSEVGYRAAWARTYLKRVGLIDNPRRGTWSLTGTGRNATNIDPQMVVAQVNRERDRSPSDPDGEDAPELDAESETARAAEPLATQLIELKDRLSSSGDLLSREDVARYLRRFRDRFGPDALAGLDGEPLLMAIHGRGARDSLVYWLEFKDDDELPGKFGGIGGGSALKFGMYQSAETEHWMTGSSTQQRRLTTDEAIALARTQRDQLVAGVRVLESYARGGADIEYAELQERLVEAAPDLAGTSWGHKYFALMSDDLLEMLHGADTQRYHLLKLLKLPVEGRYENTRIFAGIARQLGMMLFELSTVLIRRHGPQHQYWRVGTRDGALDEWPRMRDGGFAAVGWSNLGDLSDVDSSAAGREQLRQRLRRDASGPPQVITKSANQLFDFVKNAQDRDIVVAMDGLRVRGVGRIIGPYFHHGDDGPFPHRRPIQWVLVDEWRITEPERLQTTFARLGKSPRNIIEIEGRLLGAGRMPPAVAAWIAAPVAVTANSVEVPAAPPPSLTGTPARVQAALNRKRQVILARHRQDLLGRTLGAGARGALVVPAQLGTARNRPAGGARRRASDRDLRVSPGIRL